MARAQGLPEWAERLLPGPDELVAWAIGVFGLDGEPTYMNPGLRALLGGDAPSTPRRDFLVNPNFASLLERAHAATDGDLIFDGILTTGDGFRESRSVNARIWRCERQLLLSAEADVAELDRLNRELTRFNREINRLQHQLLKKNRRLEDALQELTQAQAMLAHSEKMNALGLLVAGIAHEINTPLGFTASNFHSLKETLAALSGAYADLEQRLRALDPQGASPVLAAIRKDHDLDYLLADLDPLLAGAGRGLERIAALVKQLRSFSRLDQAELATIDLSEALEEVLALVAGTLRASAIEVETDLAGLGRIDCYAAELKQVFMNLIVNAAQAMPEGGRLSIRGRTLGAHGVELTFEDTGIGIAQKDLPRVFDPFFTSKPVGSGTGLGLSLAYQTVTEQHGGRIQVQSGPGEGARFTLSLPRSPQTEPAR